MAAPQGNPGGGMFARYTGEQVNQIPAGYVEGMGAMGKAYAQIGAQLGSALTTMAAEGQKKDMMKAQAQGLLDSYTGGDVESAMYRDDTPSHVKQFLSRSMEAGGLDSMSQRDINAFMAGEQAYGTQLDRQLKQQQLANEGIKANAAAADANDPFKTLTKKIDLGTKLNERISPTVRAEVSAAAPDPIALFNQNAQGAARAASDEAKAKAQPKVDALRSAYDLARQELDRTSQKPVNLEEITDISGYEQAVTEVSDATEKASRKASTSLEAFNLAQAERDKAGSFASLQALKGAYESPEMLERTKRQRKEMIIAGIRDQKATLAKTVAEQLGQEVAGGISLSKEDEEYAAKLAAEIPDGTVINSGEGYAWVYEGGKAVFKTAKQMGVTESTGVVLPPNVKLDYGKMFGGMSQEEFAALPAKTQAFISTESKKYQDQVNASYDAILKQGEISGKTLTPQKFFGWKGMISNATELRYVINLTTARKSLEYSIDQVLAAYDKYGVSRAFSPQARAIFNSTKPTLIASVRPMVAGGNQQSDTELRTILASLPMGSDITSLKEFDVAQYRFMKIMFAKNFENHMSSVPGLEKVQTGTSLDYSSLPARTKDLINNFNAGSGEFAGMDGLSRLKHLQTVFATARDKGDPYLDSARGTILIGAINDAPFRADNVNVYLKQEQDKLTPEELSNAAALNPAFRDYRVLEGTLTTEPTPR